MNMRTTMMAGLGMLCLLGCGSEDKDTNNPALARSALPASPPPGITECTSIPDSHGYEPSLAVWAQAADAVVLATVESVEMAMPIYRQVQTDEGPEVLGELSGECTGQLYPATRLVFRNVQTLVGEDVGASLVIQNGRTDLDHYPGVFLQEGGLLDSQDKPVYPIGAQTGFALFKDDQGGWHWSGRQFEVIANQVRLQESPDPAHYQCSVQRFGIPDELDGVALTEFITAVEAARTVSLTTEEEQSVQESRPSRINSETWRLKQRSLCYEAENPAPEDPAGENNRSR